MYSFINVMPKSSNSKLMKIPPLQSPSASALHDLFHRMLDAVDLAVTTFDQDHRVIYSNQPATMLPGYVAVGSLIDSEAADNMKNNEYYDVEGNLIAYPISTIIKAVTEGRETHDLLLEYRNRGDHTECWISFSAIPVMDARGKFQYGILLYRNVTERQSCDAKLTFLLESTKILSIATDFEQRLEEKARLTVPSLADWCSIDIVQHDNSIKRVALIHRDPKKVEQVEEYERAYPLSSGMELIPERVIRTGKSEFTPVITEEIIMSAHEFNKEQRSAVLSLGLTSAMTVPIGGGGKVLGAITLAYAESGRIYSDADLKFVQEFTNHWSVLLENSRLYQEISRRDLSKDAFLAYLSHELRNPLAPIKSALELLCLHNTDKGALQDLKTITHQFNLMVRLLGDLLDTTRFTSGKIKLDTRQTDLMYIIENITKAIRPLIAQKKITLHISSPREPISVLVDPTRIEQALSNLFHNAIKFTPSLGSIWVELARNEGVLIFKIKDTGAGISASEKDHIFEPYYQSERTQEGNRGLGLGLSLVHDIILLHGGSVEVKSEGEGKGSEFIITLPVGKCESPIDYPASVTAVSTRTRASDATKKILVVDDNHAAADSLVRLLVALGWKDSIALYGAASVPPYLSQNKVDIIFLDVDMPEMNGYELVKLLRAQGYAELPIIALTGYGLAEDKQKALDAGFSGHLTKPIGTRELREVLEV